VTPQISVAILDVDGAPLAVSFDADLVKDVAKRLAEEKAERLPAPRTARYATERLRWMTLRQIAGLEPGSDPPFDAMSAWKHLEDSPVLPDEEDINR
jgi:hypothetical protein